MQYKVLLHRIEDTEKKMRNKPLKFNKEKIILFLKSDADGYSVFDSKCLTKELGFKRKNINCTIRKYVCDKHNYNRNVYRSTKIIEGHEGIVCLEFLYWLASKLGIATDNPFKSKSMQSKFLIMSILNALESHR